MSKEYLPWAGIAWARQIQPSAVAHSELHMMGGDAGPATLRGFMVLHGIGPAKERG